MDGACYLNPEILSTISPLLAWAISASSVNIDS